MLDGAVMHVGWEVIPQVCLQSNAKGFPAHECFCFYMAI